MIGSRYNFSAMEPRENRRKKGNQMRKTTGLGGVDKISAAG
jgi:hypothetical protein